MIPERSASSERQTLPVVRAPTVAPLSRAHPAIAEFQRDAVELEARAPPRITRLTLYAVTALIVGAVAWAALSTVDEIVVAPGKLITTQPNLVVQPLETSVVRSIDVAVGEIVRAGQQLAALDTTFTQSDVEQLRAKVAALEAQMGRIEAELAGLAYEPAADAGADAQLQMRFFAQRKAAYESQLRNFDDQIARAEANLAASRDEEQLLAQRVATLEQVEQMRQQLMASETGSRLNYLVSKDTRLDIESQLARNRGIQADLALAIDKARSERQAHVEEFRRAALEDLVKAREAYAAAAEELKKAELRRDMIVLSAPPDAVVLDIAQRSIGSVVREAEPLFTLVPLTVPPEAEVSTASKDIGQLGTDEPARLKIDAFPFQKHGTASGTVRTISQDSFASNARDDKGNVDASAPPVYRARIRLIDTTLRSVPDTFRLLPGMTLTAEIEVGRRRVLSYFLYPLLRGLDESLREP
ncbi:HlyD family type I secretion periplasmic adaptor subunit [Inquilinus sp. Marseille-Q2685]|uniref:HlyD family type I secretion periplasmic adaptor subunit n=1 Tax=Inquilinus sp. Marseille-Q2685 TaxID=2866581 RepID=UPI001CE429D2|nr:HlyD family type I secretion periplasmic adaptor subunit [Inquilinus sp. Marseille-Q2685]